MFGAVSQRLTTLRRVVLAVIALALIVSIPLHIALAVPGGLTWRTASMDIAGVPLYFTSVASSADGSKLVAVASGQNIYTSSNYGVTWTSHYVFTANSWKSVASSSDGTKLVAVDLGGSLYTSSNSGVTWTEKTVRIVGGPWLHQQTV